VVDLANGRDRTSGRPVERTRRYIIQVNTYLADQLRELESQSVQGMLLILLQGYDIISRERTDDVKYDIIVHYIIGDVIDS
jgi:hypothetical protein